MNHEPRDPLGRATEIRRFPTAFAVSVAVNLLFLTGAATLMRSRAIPVSPPGETGYITMEWFEASVKEPRGAGGTTSDSSRVASGQGVSVTGGVAIPPAPTPDRTRQNTAGPTPTPKSPDALRQIAAAVAVTPEPEAKHETPPPPVPPSAESVVPLEHAGVDSTASGAAGADVAASNTVPGDPSVSPPETGDGIAPVSEGANVPAPSPSPAPESGAAAAPTGGTRNAELAYQELPRLPDELRESGYRSFVRVAVEVLEDGSFTVAIRTSSGNPDIDARVLDALKRWRWKPAMKNGVAVNSTQLFRFDFDVD